MARECVRSEGKPYIVLKNVKQSEIRARHLITDDPSFQMVGIEREAGGGATHHPINSGIKGVNTDQPRINKIMKL